MADMNETPIGMIQWSEEIAQTIEPHVNALNDSITTLNNQWDIVSDTMREYKKLIIQMPDSNDKHSAQEQCDSALQSIGLTIDESVRESLGLIQMIGNMVFVLKPMPKHLRKTFNLMDSIRTTAMLDLER